MLFTTLFFAFAQFYPEEIIYVFFILPLKIKWIAWVYAAFLLLAFVTQSNSYRLALIAAISNYLIFFGPGVIQQLRQRKENAVRRKRFEIQSRPEEEPLHHCATCGATELTDPSLEFRVARDGEEYCLAHLTASGEMLRSDAMNQNDAPLVPEQGWHCLHLYYRIEHGQWQLLYHGRTTERQGRALVARAGNPRA